MTFFLFVTIFCSSKTCGVPKVSPHAYMKEGDAIAAYLQDAPLNKDPRLYRVTFQPFAGTGKSAESPSLVSVDEMTLVTVSADPPLYRLRKKASVTVGP